MRLNAFAFVRQGVPSAPPSSGQFTAAPALRLPPQARLETLNRQRAALQARAAATHEEQQRVFRLKRELMARDNRLNSAVHKLLLEVGPGGAECGEGMEGWAGMGGGGRGEREAAHSAGSGSHAPSASTWSHHRAAPRCSLGAPSPRTPPTPACGPQPAAGERG
jgi:hypothetical protein